MSSAISLRDVGIRLFACHLYNHDYLWFSSSEISKQSTTLPIIHNYALTYSLGDFSYGISKNASPQYDADLRHIPVYATPALSTRWSRTRITYNAVNSCTLRTDDAPRGVNSPDVGWRNYVDPVYPKDEREAELIGFFCYLFTFDQRVPKGVTRLGKKGAVVRVRWKEIENPLAVFCAEPVRPSHPVNPLDVNGQVITFDPISIPPHLLLRTSEVSDDWFVFNGGHRVHVPKRVMIRCQERLSFR